MTISTSERVVRSALCGLYSPPEIFENNAGLISMAEFYAVLSKEPVKQSMEVISLLQEIVFIYREKLRAIYALETEDNIKTDIYKEKQMIESETDNKIKSLLKNSTLSLSPYSIKKRFDEWPTTNGLREVDKYIRGVLLRYKAVGSH